MPLFSKHLENVKFRYYVLLSLIDHDSSYDGV